jgi:hypothetical protein
MKTKYIFAAIAATATLVGIMIILSIHFRNILITVNFLFIAGIVAFVAGAFIACKVPHFGVRRLGLQAVYPNNPPFDNARRSVKTGLLIIAAGVVMMLVSIMIWESSQHGIF